MHTPNQIDFLQISVEIAEWIERNYGYFVNKNSDKIKIIQDFSEQLERLPFSSMSYVKQVQNNFIDAGIEHPPTPATFIKELRLYHKKIKAKNGHKVISVDCFGKKYVNTFENGKFISRTSFLTHIPEQK